MVLVNRKGGISTTSKAYPTEYSKAIRHALIDRGMTQVELRKKIFELTGLKVDSSYMCKVIDGSRTPPKVIAAINKILEL